MAGAPKGNNNSNKDNRLWRNTIQRAIKQGDPDRLRRIAEKLLDKAEEGDLGALKELGDRIDGKTTQQVDNISSDGSMTPQAFPTDITITAKQSHDDDCDD